MFFPANGLLPNQSIAFINNESRCKPSGPTLNNGEVALAFNLATRLRQVFNHVSVNFLDFTANKNELLSSTRRLPALRTEPQTTSIIHHTRSSGYQNSRLPNYRQHIRNLENQAIRTLRTKPNTSPTWPMSKRWSSEAIGCSP
uniref:Uncharacterized protein n=1 Tax=Caenorhabditis japonica TaxID=281687 RepID=A0A8R1IU63_CAEJA